MTNRPEVNVRDLRNRGGDVLDRVARGEHLTVTRSGKPVAELRPLRKPPVPRAVLLARWSRLPATDPRGLREDIDALVDPSL